MTGVPSLLTYDEVRTQSGGGRRFALLGNGFSIECDPVFHYPSLYGAAVDAGLSLRAQKLFERLGTNNFEGVLRLLDDAHWVAVTYGVAPGLLQEMRDDAEVVKKTLVEAVTKSHLAHTGKVPDAKKDAAKKFISEFHHVFTTNYDLLPYWLIMHGEKPSHQDGFRSDDDDPEAPYVVFTERLGDTSGLFFLHGALHYFLKDGELCKHCWCRTNRLLTDQIKEGLASGRYPLFVAEGSPDKKLEQIQRVGYLWYALEKFSRIESPLVVFGHSLGSSDGHIANAIADNLALSKMYVGLHGDSESASNLAIRGAVDQIVSRREERLKGKKPAKKKSSLEVQFYDSGTAKPWG